MKTLANRNGSFAGLLSSRRALTCLLALTCLAAVAGPGSAGAAELPEKDPFYKPPAGFESDAPGTVLRSREVTVPEASDDKTYQLLFRSNNTFDEPIAAVTTVIVPDSTWIGVGERPLASYQEPIDSLGAHCNPSYELQEGTEYEDQWGDLLSRGWAVNIPDFEGEDMEFAAGEIAAHIVLDSIRAIYNFKAAGLSPSNPLGLIGYSGGGQATAWALEQQPSYAPELHIVAGAPGGIPVYAKEVAEYDNGGVGFGLILAASVGLDRAYPELELNSLLNAEGLAAEKKIENQCLTEYVENYPFKKFSEYTKPEYPEPLDVPQVEKVLVADSLAKAVPAEPAFLWQSKTDELVPAAGVERLANYYCSEGVDVTFDLGASGEHISYDVDNFPAAATYLEERFNGESVASTCGVNASENTAIESGPSGKTNEDSATFTYAAEPEVAGTTFECKLDQTEFESCPASGVTFSDVAAGAHTFQVRSVTATGDEDVSPATRSFVVTGADLGVSISATPNPATVKKRLAYTITVQNAGPEAASGVVLTNALTGSLRLRNAQASAGECSVHKHKKEGRSVVCELGELEAGARVTVTIAVTPTETGTVSNTASVTDSGPPNRTPADSTATETTAVNPRR